MRGREGRGSVTALLLALYPRSLLLVLLNYVSFFPNPPKAHWLLQGLKWNGGLKTKNDYSYGALVRERLDTHTYIHPSVRGRWASPG